MTKFEEEVKRPDNTGIDPFSKRDVDFSKIAEKFTRGAQTLKSWRNYADYKEHQLEQKDEQIQSLAKMVDKLNGQNVDLKGELEEVRDLQGEANNQAAKEYIDRCEAESKLKELKSQLQQQALPVVPEFVAEFIDECKKEGDCLFGIFADATSVEHDMPDLVYFWLGDEGNNDELFARAWLDGYTIEKPQLFYLKNKLTTSYLALDTNTGHYEHWGEEIIPKLLNKQGYKLSFTQQEIDSMETRSYEQIEVTE